MTRLEQQASPGGSNTQVQFNNSNRLGGSSNLTWTDGTQLLTITGTATVSGTATASNFVSNVATGTAPYACTSTTVNTNLNADLLDGINSTAFALQKVTSTTVSGGPVTSVTISGLDLGTDLQYYISFSYKNGTAVTMVTSFYVNGDTTATNYNRQQVVANNTSITGARANNSQFASSTTGNFVTGQIWMIKDLAGNPRWEISVDRDAVTVPLWALIYGAHNSTTNVTSITFSSDTTDSIANDSIFNVYKII